MDVLVLERLLVEGRLLADPVPLPGADVRVVVVVALGLALLGLVLDPEVTAAGLLAATGVEDELLTELEEVGDPAGLDRKSTRLNSSH